MPSELVEEKRRARVRRSLFPKVPPFHVFLPTWISYDTPACAGLREEEWQFPSQIMPVVRDTVAHAGFKITKGILRSECTTEVIMAGFIWDNMPLVEKAIDAIDFSRIREGVKINKFPGFLDLNRKDTLWLNFRRMQKKFGKAFDFHPDTFQLPAEHDQLVKRMEEEKCTKVYIVKLPNNMCGIGACVIDSPSKIPRKIKVHTKEKQEVKKEDPIIVQSYIPNPLLIHGYKFDFRLYVLVTSINPLRIYLYKDGMVRVAMEKLSLESEDLENTFIHLTNFAQTKRGESKTCYPEGCQANKWSVYELWAWMKERGEDPKPFWARVKDVVIKTILCGHKKIDTMVKESVGSFYNNYNILGFDILMDENHGAHLLEVNTIPSMFINKSSEEIDLRLKGPVLAESFNIAGHHITTSIARKHKDDIISSHLDGQISGSLGFDHRLYCKGMTGMDKEKQERFVAPGDDPEEDSSGNSSVDEENTEKEGEENSDSGRGRVLMEGGEDILEDLSPCDVRVLVHSEEELSQCETFERIFPTTETGHYLQYMETNYYDLLLLAWERKYDQDRQTGRDRLVTLTEAGVHLEVPPEDRLPQPAVPRTSAPMKKTIIVPRIFSK